MNNGTVGIIVGCVIGGIVLLLLGIGAVYYAYQRHRKFDLAESTRACGEVSEANKVEMMDSGRLNADQSVRGKHDKHGALSGALRYFNQERLGTAAH